MAARARSVRGAPAIVTSTATPAPSGRTRSTRLPSRTGSSPRERLGQAVDAAVDVPESRAQRVPHHLHQHEPRRLSRIAAQRRAQAGRQDAREQLLAARPEPLEVVPDGLVAKAHGGRARAVAHAGPRAHDVGQQAHGGPPRRGREAGIEDEVEEAPRAIAADVVALAHGEGERHGGGREAEAPRQRPHPREAVAEQRDTRVDRVAAHAIRRHAAADASARLEHERREPGSRSARAAPRPAIPPPTTITSASWPGARRASHMARRHEIRPPPTSGGS